MSRRSKYPALDIIDQRQAKRCASCSSATLLRDARLAHVLHDGGEAPAGTVRAGRISSTRVKPRCGAGTEAWFGGCSWLATSKWGSGLGGAVGPPALDGRRSPPRCSWRLPSQSTDLDGAGDGRRIAAGTCGQFTVAVGLGNVMKPNSPTSVPGRGREVTRRALQRTVRHQRSRGICGVKSLRSRRSATSPITARPPPTSSPSGDSRRAPVRRFECIGTAASIALASAGAVCWWTTPWLHVAMPSRPTQMTTTATILDRAEALGVNR